MFSFLLLISILSLLYESYNCYRYLHPEVGTLLTIRGPLLHIYIPISREKNNYNIHIPNVFRMQVAIFAKS